ncbi:MAG TPA: DUF1294 domain-containing protein [Methylophilaceae bacterium]|jgi:uncharacterized membrane protein YsdA (DUF1294 family)|nr:DUF1294 domain-containing protein [Methylophilaceae bacterium]
MSHIQILSLYTALSLITATLYALDKSAARRGHWRIPEYLLHLLAVVGGWPGALAAQQMIRHKSRKLRFQIVFWLTVVINSCFLWWLLIR